MNRTILATTSRSKSILRALGAVLCATFLLACTTSTAHAAIGWSGGVNPDDPNTWLSTTFGYIGQNSEGTVTVDGGSEMLSYYGYVGDDSAGTATVTGHDSKWTNSTELYVGNGSNGTLNIEAGGQVSSYNSYLSYSSESTGTATVTGHDSKWTNGHYLYIGYYGGGSLDIEASGQVSNTLSYLGYSTGSTGTVTVDGAGSMWSAHALEIGFYGNGTLNIQAGGQVTSNFGAVVGDHSTGTATITGAGSTWTNYDSLIIGNVGNGTLNIEAGGQVSNTYGYVGRVDGSNSTATVTGADSKWTNSGPLNIGYFNSRGTLNINAGGQVSNTDGCLGYNSGATGIVSVAGTNSKWTNLNDLNVGDYGSGTMNVGAGGEVSNDNSYLGHNSGSTGTVTVTGAGSKWTNSDNLNVGFSGSGTLNIESGGQVSNTNGTLGNQPGSTGTATVTGRDSMWTNSGHLYVGNVGRGTLNIESGGQVSNSTGYLGSSPEFTSTATVTGAGSKWTNYGDLRVGCCNGSGTLNIKAGGQVSDNNGFMGDFSAAVGVATVTGTGSKWTNAGNLYVGVSGSGTLNIGSGTASGGLVTAKNLYLGNQSIGNGICNLNGGVLQTGSISRGSGTATFNWSDGTIRNYDADTDLTVPDNLVLKLASAGTHTFNIDLGRSGTVEAILSDATSGGTLTKTGPGLLTLTAENAYSGDTDVEGGALSIRIPYLDDLSGVRISAGALLDLNFLGSDTVGSLDLDGLPAAYGTWGSSLTLADHIDNIHFSGTGMLNVVPEPSMLVLLGIGVCGLTMLTDRKTD